jgi:putative tricarboxylic transport membrane protein
MGPGFFPVAVGVALAALGLAIIAEVRHSSAPAPDLPLRPMALIVAGLVVFAVLVGRAGLVPATLALVLISAFADRAMTPLRALVSALGITAMGYLVFVLGFRLPLHPFWW